MEKDIAKIALFAALIAVLGLIPAIALGSGVPITAQGLGVMLAGAILGPKRGALAVLLLLLGVALGLPLLAQGRGGLGVFVGPTVGYLIGFPIAAYVTGLVVQKLRGFSPFITASIGAILGGIVAMYICGTIGMAVVLEKSLGEAFFIALIYLPGDLIKVAVTGLVYSALAKSRPELLSWRDDGGKGL